MQNKYKYELTLIIPAKDASRYLANTIEKTKDTLLLNKINSEVIVVINNSSKNEERKMIDICLSFDSSTLPVKFKIHSTKGKGEAIALGLQEAEGKYIGFLDADLPYDPVFFKSALSYLEEGFDLVTFNRRSGDTKVELTIKELIEFSKREKSSQQFNYVINKILGLKTKDTQAGMKCFSRRLSKVVFNQNYCKGYYFDIELFLACNQNGWKIKESSRSKYNYNPESTITFSREYFKMLFWLTVFWFRKMTNHYFININEHLFFTCDDWGISPSVNKAILNLVEKNIVKRVSIMSNEKYVNYYLSDLLSFDDLELGLHVNLTHSSVFDSVGKLLRFSLNPFIDKELDKKIEEEIESQIQSAIKKEIKISYIDGHHHCHVFPKINNKIIDLAQKHGIQKARLPFCVNNFLDQKIILNLFSVLTYFKFKKMKIDSHKFYYPRYEKLNNKQELIKKLKNKKGYEVITHPSTENDFELLSVKDNYTSGRIHEYNLLMEFINE